MLNSHQSLGWGIIGIGRHADRFMAPAILKSRQNHLVGVYSRDINRARQFAANHGSPEAYDDLHKLLANADINAVYIGSPNYIHKEQTILAAEAGKHILCDKPLATTEQEALEMIQACHKAKVKLGVGFHLRHNPLYSVLKTKMNPDILGELVLVEIQYMHVTAGSESKYKLPTWRNDPALAGGGKFISTGVHAIDLLRFVTGREITSACAFADKSFYTAGGEQLIQVSLSLEESIPASLSAGMMRYPSNDLVLYGTKATLRCSGSLGYLGGGQLEIVSDEGENITNFPESDVYHQEIDDFSEKVWSDEQPNASGFDGLQAVRVTEGIYRSIRARSIVDISKGLFI